MVRLLIKRVMPYFERRQEAKQYANRTLEDTRTAMELANASSEQVKFRRLADGSMWWFANKRILGFPRPAISDAEVDDYLVIRTMEVWTWNEFLVFQRVRMFNLVDCTCLPNGQFASCSHTLSRACVCHGRQGAAKEHCAGQRVSQGVPASIG